MAPRKETADTSAADEKRLAEEFRPIIGDIGERPRYFDAPHEDANEVHPEIGKPAATDLWVEVTLANSKTKSYILRYRKGDMVPSVWDAPPAGSWNFAPDLTAQPIR